MRNRVKCARCGDVIESKYRHDFQQCSCSLIFCDGGLEYQRLGFSKPSDIIRILDDETEVPFSEASPEAVTIMETEKSQRDTIPELSFEERTNQILKEILNELKDLRETIHHASE